MSDQIRFHLDENVAHAVAKALRRRGVDVTTTADSGLRQASDLEQLAYARQERRVLVTHDADFLRHHANGVQHAGVAYCKKEARPIGQIIETLRLIFEVMTTSDMENNVEYL